MNRSYEFPGDSEQIVRAAWLYHVAGNTQEHTADLLGISRIKVNRLLAEARESGIVKISIEHRFARMVEIEESLRRRYDLAFCRTTPPLMSYISGRRKSLPSRPCRPTRPRSSAWAGGAPLPKFPIIWSV